MGSVTSQRTEKKAPVRWVWRLVQEDGRLVKKLVKK